MRFSSMTWPSDPLRVSSSGVSAATLTTSLDPADFQLEIELEAIADADLDVVALDFLEALQLGAHPVGAGGQIQERIRA